MTGLSEEFQVENASPAYCVGFALKLTQNGPLLFPCDNDTCVGMPQSGTKVRHLKGLLDESESRLAMPCGLYHLVAVSVNDP